MIQYSVGGKFDKKMPQDGAIFEIQNNLCQCVIGLRNISKKEIAAVDRGKITFDLCYVNGIIFLCANFSEIMFFEMPFNMKLYDKFQLTDPGTNGYLMPVFLVDNETNTIMAMRGLGFKNEFSRKLYELSNEQWTKGVEDYNTKLEKTYLTHPRSKLLDNRIAQNVFGGLTNEKAK